MPSVASLLGPIVFFAWNLLSEVGHLAEVRAGSVQQEVRSTLSLLPHDAAHHIAHVENDHGQMHRVQI